MRQIVILLGLCVLIASCSSASSHRRDVNADDGQKLTVGTVQKEIRVGMSGSDVATVLGSPNIVTTDEDRREVWIYDRISTERVYSTSSGGISSLILGGWPVGSGVLGGLGGGNYDRASGASSTSQQSFTVIIKFDNQKRVRDFAYHTSRF